MQTTVVKGWMLENKKLVNEGTVKRYLGGQHRARLGGEQGERAFKGIHS